MAIARYTLAVDRRGRRNQDDEQQNVDFISCVAFDKTAEFTEKYFCQGMRVLISGRIQTGSYTNREGQKIYTTDVIVDEQEFADSKKKAREQEPPVGTADNLGGGWMNVPDNLDDEGLPFS